MKSLAHVLATTLLCLTSILAHADGSVWKATKGDTTLYLGGTFHLLHQNDYPLPSGYQTAFDAADEIYFETDLSAVNDPQFQMKMMQLMTLQNGQKLSDVLTPETYSKLETYMQQNGLPLAQFSSLTPTGLSLTISVIEMQKLGMNPMLGVDQHFFSQAKGSGKPVGSLETVEEQVQFLAGLGEGQEDAMVLSTLEEMKNLQQNLDELRLAWRQGDMDALDNIGNKQLRDEFPKAYQSLIVERNQNWMEEIKQMARDDDTELMLVGALHLAGPDGLLSQLESLGYSVEQL